LYLKFGGLVITYNTHFNGNTAPINLSRAIANIKGKEAAKSVRGND